LRQEKDFLRIGRCFGQLLLKWSGKGGLWARLGGKWVRGQTGERLAGAQVGHEKASTWGNVRSKEGMGRT